MTTTRRYARRPKRVADKELHLWPNHAFVCEVCRWPVDRVTHPLHPTCEPTTDGA